PLHVERRGVHELKSGLPQEELLRVHAGFGALLQLLEDGSLRRFQDAVESAEHGEREDNLAVLMGFVVTAEEVGDGPDERGEVGLCHRYLRVRRAAARHGGAVGGSGLGEAGWFRSRRTLLLW